MLEMHEPTVITEPSVLLRLLRDCWGLTAEKIVVLDRGTAFCRKIHSGKARYLLKEYQAGYPRARVEGELPLVEHIRHRGVAVGRIIPTCRGNGAAEFRGRIFQLQPYIEGQAYPKFQGPAWMARELPRTLATIALSLRDYPSLPTDYRSWFERDMGGRDRLFAGFAERTESASWLTDEQRRRLAEGARRRRAAIRAVSNWNLSAVPFTYTNSHGDYSILQVIASDTSITAVIDFARAANLPIAWEILRSFSYLDPACRDGGIDAAALRSYVRAFEEVLPLSAADRAHMVELYAYQLAPSSFGFRQTLEGPCPNAEELIDFACWRTAFCETLIARRSELTDSLCR